jgi:Cu2+-exporting ATPase
MRLSSFCVVSNALRLNWIKVYDGTKDKAISNRIDYKIIQSADAQTVNDTILNDKKEKEKKEMKIKVNGMMCAHCEAHVKKALEAIDGIESAVASHEENMVTITNSKDVDEALIKAAVTDAGYEYAGIA